MTKCVVRSFSPCESCSFTHDTFWLSSSSFSTQGRHLFAGPLPLQSVAIIVVRKQMWIHTLERKSVCDCGLVRLHGMVECECLCVCRVWAGGFRKIWLGISLPGFLPLTMAKMHSLAILCYPTAHTNTHKHSMKGVVVHIICDCELTLVTCGQTQRDGWEVVTYSLACDWPLEVKKTHMHTRSSALRH